VGPAAAVGILMTATVMFAAAIAELGIHHLQTHHKETTAVMVTGKILAAVAEVLRVPAEMVRAEKVVAVALVRHLLFPERL
jgi:hypothetical protein